MKSLQLLVSEDTAGVHKAAVSNLRVEEPQKYYLGMK